MLNLLTTIFSFIASAGGGGSSSGGSGGGGFSSSSGSSDGSGDMPGFMAVMFLMALPTGLMTWLTRAAFMRSAYRHDDKSIIQRGKKAALVVGVVAAVILSIAGTLLYASLAASSREAYNDDITVDNMWQSATGREELQSKDVGPFFYDYIIGLVFAALGSAGGVWYGMRISVSGYERKIKERDRQRRLQNKLAKAAANDAVWNPDYLRSGVQNVFLAYQRDWSNLNIAATSAYLTERYGNHVNLMLTAFRESGRVNNTIVHRVDLIEITDATNSDDNAQDQFTAHIMADITDQLIDSTNGRVMSSSRFKLSEDWLFRRDGNSWRLDGINPSTAAERTRAGSIQRFAESSGAYYSLDWGRMLLPSRGQIFGGSVYKTADVNNHVIGRMQSTGRIFADDVIYQIYTYSQKPYDNSRVVYLVGQMFVPKLYGNILLCRTDIKGSHRKPFGLRQIDMEWGEFNNKFRVYATSAEQVTAFELLHPAMMQTLVDAPFAINIEVIDNAIYFYAPLSRTSAKDYQAMLSVLQAAYRELKM